MLIGCLTASPFVFATGDGFYMGVQVGYANLNNVAQDINTGQLFNGPSDSSTCDPSVPFNSANPKSCLLATNVTPTNTGIAARVFMGANVQTYFGFEFGMSYYTPSEYNPDVSGFTHEPHIWEYSGDILGKVMYPFGPITLFAKGGIGIVYKTQSDAIITSSEEDSNGSVIVAPAYGFGVSYDITPRWVADFSYMRIQGGNDIKDINFAGVGISYHFVDEYCGQFLC